MEEKRYITGCANCSFKAYRGNSKQEMYVETLIVVAFMNVDENSTTYFYQIKGIGYDNKCPYACYMDLPIAEFKTPQEAFAMVKEICKKYPPLQWDDTPFEDYPLLELEVKN